MRLILKVVIALAVIVAATVAYADIPDVSKWVCPDAVSKNSPDHGIESMSCDKIGSGNIYVKAAGELIYIHEHRMDNDKVVYYNALKTEKNDQWIEVVNKKDLVFDVKSFENGEIEISISDDNGAIIAKRIIPSLKR